MVKVARRHVHLPLCFHVNALPSTYELLNVSENGEAQQHFRPNTKCADGNHLLDHNVRLAVGKVYENTHPVTCKWN